MHTIVILTAKYLIFLNALAVLGYFFFVPSEKKKQFLFDAVIGAALVYGMAKIASAVFYNARPFVVGHFEPYFQHANNNGFPSDHTLFASFLAFLVFRYNKIAGSVLLLVAVAIGGARVIAGVHHVEDIIGAMIIAGVGMIVTYGISRLIFKGGKGGSSKSFRVENHPPQNLPPEKTL